MTRAVLLLFAVAGLLAVAVLRRREPVPPADLTFRESDDGIQPPDPPRHNCPRCRVLTPIGRPCWLCEAAA